MDNTWEITTIISHFNDSMEKAGTDTKKCEAVKELYAQAIRLQCTTDCGYVMTTDDFIECVKSASFIDYDGFGEFADFDGRKHEYVNCDVKWLQKNRKDYPFVYWYNK